MISYRRALSIALSVVGIALLLTAGAILHEGASSIDWIVAAIVGIAGACLLSASYRVDDRLP